MFNYVNPFIIYRYKEVFDSLLYITQKIYSSDHNELNKYGFLK